MKKLLISILAIFAISAPVAALNQNSWHNAQYSYGQMLQAPSNFSNYISNFFVSKKPVLAPAVVQAPSAPFYAPLIDPKNSANVTMGSIPVYMGSYGYLKYKMWQLKKAKLTENIITSGNLYGQCPDMPKEPSKLLYSLKHPIKTMRRAMLPVLTTTIIAPTITGFAHHVACSK